jgi:hypothetical protein
MALCSCLTIPQPDRSRQAGDFAMPEARDCWLHHTILGEPSFDAFRRLPGNPVIRGAAPYEWPVNGFLLRDPASGDWFLYAGLYRQGYAIDDQHPCRCEVWRSRDQGVTWERLGPVFDDSSPFVFEDGSFPVVHAPDVAVVYDGGRYHLVYDYLTAGASWSTIGNPTDGTDNGIAYAWSDRPEGPFQRTSPAIYSLPANPARLGKYRRMYAQTLVRRRDDWLVLAMMDSGPFFGWALVALRADRPEGPYEDPVFLLHPESDHHYPALLEYFPAFVHDGYVYAPATSVALNRNVQFVFRAPLDQALEPAAWEAFLPGSVWHGLPIEHESHGIWGQTFSAFVDPQGVLQAMFPSRDRQGMGTLNLARRPWNQPYRERGFVVSGHRGPSLALLRRTCADLDLTCTFRRTGGQLSICWDWQAPLGPDDARADASLHPLTRTRHRALRITDEAWALGEVDAHGDWTPTAGGERTWEETQTVTIRRNHEDGLEVVVLDHETVWHGQARTGSGGPVALLVEPETWVEVESLILRGTEIPCRLHFLATEAILNAAERPHWRTLDDPLFRYGSGALTDTVGATAKWNFAGTACEVWGPGRPGYGAATVVLDGKEVGRLSARADAPTESQPLLRLRGLPPGSHALTLKVEQTPFPLDSLTAGE